MEGGFGRRTGTVKSAETFAAQKANGENRFAPRRPSAIPAQIYFDGTVTSVPCLIKDMSTTGAKLELRTGWDNPFKSDASQMERIRLVIRMDRVMYDCKIVRRSETELGVKFTAAPKPMTKVIR
ncbi:MAG: PilZ domain-containing protein [Hyphomicrobium sp.]|nr:PilZ domain-containing protein [Hyphomicrobium sp.]